MDWDSVDRFSTKILGTVFALVLAALVVLIATGQTDRLRRGLQDLFSSPEGEGGPVIVAAAAVPLPAPASPPAFVAE